VGAAKVHYLDQITFFSFLDCVGISPDSFFEIQRQWEVLSENLFQNLWIFKPALHGTAPLRYRLKFFFNILELLVRVSR
jgi:hypothetical protein